MDLANLSDAEARAVLNLHRLRHIRVQYANAIAEAEEATEPLSEVDAGAAKRAIAEEPTRVAKEVDMARQRMVARKAEAERMAKAQADAKKRKCGD